MREIQIEAQGKKDWKREAVRGERQLDLAEDVGNECHAKTPVSLGTLPAKLLPLYLSFTPTYLLRKSSVNPYILKLFK
jgi:hypothetical protein